jgi:hypothetical protein
MLLPRATINSIIAIRSLTIFACLPTYQHKFNENIAFRLASHQNGQAVGLAGGEKVQWNTLTGISGGLMSRLESKTVRV